MASVFSSHAQADAPDFMVDVYHEGAAFGAILTPPADHHFNIEAPYSAKVEAKNIAFGTTEVQKARIVFEKIDATLVAADSLKISAFLCDNAKTFCIKKSKVVTLAANAPKPAIGQVAPVGTAAPAKKSPDKASPKKSAAKKDEFGFWENSPAEAFAESAQTHKPVMIDFYGIWCPPCNQFNESVFPTADFKAMAKKFVLLKMDADQDTSWALKSHFKIGGYPTQLIMKAPAAASTEVTKLEEIDRIVGFFPTAEFVKKMGDAYANRNQRFEDRILAMKADYLDGLQKLIETKWEQKDFASAVAFAEEGSKTRPDDLYFQLVKLQGQVRAQPELLKEKSSLQLLTAIETQRKTLSVETLMRAQDLIVSNAETLKLETIRYATDLLNALAERLNPKTLTVDGYELSAADLYAFKFDAADAAKDEAGKKAAREGAIDSYQKLIAMYGKKEARGLSLELAYWLWNDGKADQAKKIYDHFIQKYPKEFTFYFASAKMNLDLKKYAEAKAQAEKAVEYSYGDNHLRSMERLVRALTAAGEPKVAVEKGNALLAQTKDPKGYAIRTDRYIVALKKAVDAAQKEIH